MAGIAGLCVALLIFKIVQDYTNKGKHVISDNKLRLICILRQVYY